MMKRPSPPPAGVAKRRSPDPAKPKSLTPDELPELYYLVGRLVGFRAKVGYDIDELVYHDQYRVRIDHRSILIEDAQITGGSHAVR